MQSDERVQRLLNEATEAARNHALALLAPLVTYDQLHSGDLLNTLKTYLRLQANASAAAEALFLHRSGLLYRLRRIEDLLALRLDVFEHRAAIELALLALDAHPQRQSE